MALSSLILKKLGWEVVYKPVESNRAVYMVYPHTSNWDFPLGLLWKIALPFKISYLIKNTWMHPAIGWFFKGTGAIAIDRSNKSQNYVDTIASLFNQHQELIIVVAPEGTRSFKPYLRSGFYHIAKHAGVPIGLAFIDYKNKRVGVEHYLMPSDDIDADFEKIRAYYSHVGGRIPKNQGTIEYRKE